MVFMTIVKAWQSSVICFGGLNLSTTCQLPMCPTSWQLAEGLSHNNTMQVPTPACHLAGVLVIMAMVKYLIHGVI